MEAKPYKIPHPFRKLNKELIDTLVYKISQGSTHKSATLSSGITPRIFEIWVNQGVIDIEFENEDSLPAYLVRSLNKVKDNEIVSCRQDIRNSDKGHKGAEWTLEHAYWRDFGSDAINKDLAERLDKLEQAQHDKDESNGGQTKELDSESN